MDEVERKSTFPRLLAAKVLDLIYVSQTESLVEIWIWKPNCLRRQAQDIIYWHGQ